MKNKEKLTGILLFVALLMGLFYISLFTQTNEKKEVGKIELSGNNFLTTEQYFIFARLNNRNDFSHLSLPVIKDRIEKHPYVNNAEVTIEKKGVVHINIKEKQIQASLLVNGNEFLITDDFQLIPRLDFTKNVVVPLIVNFEADNLKTMNVLKNEELKTVFKIIDAAKIIDSRMYSELSQIDLNYGKDIILSFSSLDFDVKLGRGNEISKIMYLDKIWEKLNKNRQSVAGYIHYIDLRFDKLICVGVADSVMEVEKGIQG